MDDVRPGTAPCGQRRAAPEHWTQVDALVQDMFGSVASAATSSTARQRRPHTACVCARPVFQPSADNGEEDSYDESDGGSMDEGLPEELLDSPRPLSAATPYSKLQTIQHMPTASCSSTAASSSLEVAPQSSGYPQGRSNPAMPAPAYSAGGYPQRVPELPQEMALLLSGKFFGQVRPSPTQASSPSSPSDSAGATAGEEGRDVAAKAAAVEKLPKQCLFLDFGSSRPATGRVTAKGAAGPRGILAPRAARMKSHMSWAHYLPARHLQNDAEASNKAMSQGSASNSSQAAAVQADSSPPADSTISEPQTEVEATQLTPTPPESAPKKRGPKYTVAPGASRPRSLSRKPQKVPPSEFMVLEFRTEPRVVPASRNAGQGRNGPVLFRPKARDWASERDFLSMR